MDQNELIPHLFRTEYTKLVAVLAKRFGFAQLEIAEDLASETFLTAAQSSGIEGPPSNPSAWLYQVAKNKAINYLKRQTHFNTRISTDLKLNQSDQLDKEIDLSAQNISDSQLQMMFTICHPSISTEAQIGLSLRILCGFGIDEIATAFLIPKETINKRLFRAKEKLREQKINIELPSPALIDARLETVLKTIYLLFNEGYYSVNQNQVLRKDLCLEAIRLCTILLEHEATNKPLVNALMALMCFHTSRFDARVGQYGELILYEKQNTALWNTAWIDKGIYFLAHAAKGNHLSAYHLEAGIAYWHTQKMDGTEKWEAILNLYDQLLQLEYSPIAALNRIYALYRSGGIKNTNTTIEETKKLNLSGHFFYYLLLGELYKGIDREQALIYLNQALTIAKNSSDKLSVQNKIDKLRFQNINN